MKIEDLSLVKRIVEAALMASEKPLTRRAIKDLFDEMELPDDELLDQALAELEKETEQRGYELKKVASGYRYQVRQDLSRWIGKLWKEKAPRYSRALLETLSLIAYRQPITRGEIEDIRGVAVSTQIVKTLLEREWVKVVGHRDVPGRPAMYATTKQFLDYFNLKSLDQLPPLAEIRDLNTISRELNIELPLELADSANDEVAESPESEAAADEALVDSASGQADPTAAENVAGGASRPVDTTTTDETTEKAVFEEWIGSDLEPEPDQDQEVSQSSETSSRQDNVESMLDEELETHAMGASTHRNDNYSC